MRFFDLIQQHHPIGIAEYVVDQLVAVVIPHVPGSRAHESGHGDLLHVFGHIDTQQFAFISIQFAAQHTGRLGLTHTRWADKQENTIRPFGVDLHTHSGGHQAPHHGIQHMILAHNAPPHGMVQMPQPLLQRSRQSGQLHTPGFGQGGEEVVSPNPGKPAAPGWSGAVGHSGTGSIQELQCLVRQHAVTEKLLHQFNVTNHTGEINLHPVKLRKQSGSLFQDPVDHRQLQFVQFQFLEKADKYTAILHHPRVP